jgi:hypothetical protein
MNPPPEEVEGVRNLFSGLLITQYYRFSPADGMVPGNCEKIGSIDFGSL